MTIPGPSIVGIGGTTTPGSTTERALNLALQSAESAGARIRHFTGAEIAELPHYAPGVLASTRVGRELIESVRAANGLIVASPGYHGSISGLVKNALDFLEETARDTRVYLDGVPVGLIVTAYGWQATGSTLGALRSIVHALRGWPTPLGAAIKSSASLFVDGECRDASSATQLELVGQQVVEFAEFRLRTPAATATGPIEGPPNA